MVESEEPTSVGELAETTGLPKSTTSRLVGALERQGLVQRDGRASIRPGPVLLRFAGRDDFADLVTLAGDTLDRLAAASGETVNLGVATPRGVDQLDQRDGRHFIGSTNWVGRQVPLHCTAQGKVFLAYGIAALSEVPLDRHAPRTIVEPDALARELETVRTRGYATTLDELEPGLWAAAAPVVGSRRRRRRRCQHLRPDHALARRAAGGARRTARRGNELTVRPTGNHLPEARCRMTHEEILQGLFDKTLVGNAPAVRELTELGLEEGLEPESMLYEGLIPSLEEVGARFERGDFFVPEMLIAARAMQGALDILRPLLAD